ncbi:hypothetical protein PVW53_04450 [Seohaeicola sp. SP36]|uniref:hypothetical protein n=1 Tax=unclassified Seohaeicola TaxID=2641111 RepID=UPI00237A3985|nr:MULTISPECIES: hypothetical protein [unclassified Seohaeicola]MDD9707766.1 hypothetical protein [Seohaeicola sp. 4SK31]MDD9734762.1 hypothetical protein [Seohaeicola sp. SP36]
MKPTLRKSIVLFVLANTLAGPAAACSSSSGFIAEIYCRMGTSIQELQEQARQMGTPHRTYPLAVLGGSFASQPFFGQTNAFIPLLVPNEWPQHSQTGFANPNQNNNSVSPNFQFNSENERMTISLN